MFEDLIIIIVTHGLVFWAGYRFGIHTAVMRIVVNLVKDPNTINQVLKEYQQVIEEAKIEESGKIEVDIEWNNGYCYLYRKDNGEFLGQGPTVDEAIKNITKLIKGVEYYIPSEMAKKPE